MIGMAIVGEKQEELHLQREFGLLDISHVRFCCNLVKAASMSMMYAGVAHKPKHVIVLSPGPTRTCRAPTSIER